MSEIRLSRRGALAGAAWSAPVVVVAGAVPAFAASPSTSLLLVPGTTAAVLGTDVDASYFDLRFTGLSVVVPGRVDAGLLTVTTTFSPATPGGPSGLVLLGDPPPAPWTIDLVGSSVVLTHGVAVEPGDEVQVPNGVFLGSEGTSDLQTGTFVVTASAPGLASATQGFSTSTPGARRVSRPR